MPKYDGTSLSAAHVGVDLAGFIENLDDGTLTAAQGTKLQTILDGLNLAQSDVGALTDSSGGATPDGTIAAVSGSGADAAINNNFADVAAKINAIRTALRASGIMS